MSLPFFGDEHLYKRRALKKSDLKPIKGFTHADGDLVSDSFVRFMQRVADTDFEESHSDVQERVQREGVELARPSDTKERTPVG